jgi:hypothetical protein
MRDLLYNTSIISDKDVATHICFQWQPLYFPLIEALFASFRHDSRARSLKGVLEQCEQCLDITL